MKTYLFDASAAVQIYLPGSELAQATVRYALEQQEQGQAVLFIPNFCVAEVLNTFAKKHFGEKGMGDEEYKRILEDFRNHIHWGKTLYAYDLNRYHIVAADKIIPAEHKRPRRDRHDYLSTFDILIIAMACELSHTRGVDNVALLTCDSRLGHVCNDLRKQSFRSPKGPLGDLEDKRWVAPRCFDLLKNSVTDIISFQMQSFH
jgi:predicted nucleic acid-binding protein